MSSQPYRPYCIPEAKLLPELALDQPAMIVVALFADHAESYFLGGRHFFADTRYDVIGWDTIQAIRRRDPRVPIMVYQRVPNDLRWQTMGPHDLGEGWYVLGAPEKAPRLIQAERIVWGHPPAVVAGRDLDTNAALTEAVPIVHFVGPAWWDVTPLCHPAARLKLWEVMPSLFDYRQYPL